MNKLPSFIMFLTIFFTLYGLLNFYFYRKVARAFDMGIISHLSLVVVLCFLLLSPFMMNMSAKTDHYLLTKTITYVGYIWMGVLFLFFSINILIDTYRLIIHISGSLFSPVILRYIPGDRITFIITLLLITGINIYGWIEAGNITVEKIKLRTTKLPPHIGSLRIVQISDTHFSAVNGVVLAQKIVRIIRDLQPDVLVSTGDLVDRGLQEKEKVIDLLIKIKAPYGKYATTGNHEFIAGIKYTTEFTEKAGFKMLRNENVTIGDFLNIGAIDDPAASRFGIASNVSEGEVIESFSPDHINIFLKHQPRVDKKSIGKFDLQLSGHTHNGQIFPFSLIVSMFYTYLNGLFELDDNCYLYVTSGTGTWGPPIRFLTFPEIAVIDFKREG